MMTLEEQQMAQLQNALSGDLGGQWQDPWQDWQREMTDQRYKHDIVERIKQMLEQQRQVAEMQKRAMSKQDMIRGIMRDMEEIRQKLDMITAALTTEILTEESEPAPQTDMRSAMYAKTGKVK